MWHSTLCSSRPGCLASVAIVWGGGLWTASLPGPGHWPLVTRKLQPGGGGKYRQIRDSSLIAGNTSHCQFKLQGFDEYFIHCMGWCWCKSMPLYCLCLLPAASYPRVPLTVPWLRQVLMSTVSLYISSPASDQWRSGVSTRAGDRRGSRCHRRPFMQLVGVT